MPILKPHEVRLAALSFPSDTGLGTDNVALRAFSRLSDDALHGLARLFKACEDTGSWGATVRLVLIVLLAKSDGGRRPIGLFPSLIRLWMRTRTWMSREWERQHHRDGIFGGKGMSAQRAAWQVAFQAESAALSKQHFAHSLLDLVKAFEKVPHYRVAMAARKHGYNLTVLRLTFAAYRINRVIGVLGVVSRQIKASNGITAGSAFAIAELRTLLLDMYDDTYKIWISIRLTLYVDDLTIEASGSHSDVRTSVAGATDFFRSLPAGPTRPRGFS